MVKSININNQAEVGRWVQSLIDKNRLHDFYISVYWERLRREVLADDKYECQHCKRRGFYKRADTVHHVQYIRKHPSLALSKVYIFQGKEYRNLISLCHACHEAAHGYRQKEKPAPLTPERW